MLKGIRLNNFKSARDLPLATAPLTVLAGLNGSGKSTVLQALGLVYQSLLVNDATPRLHLRGPLLELGRVEDVFFEGASNDELAITLRSNTYEARISCLASPKTDTLPMNVEGASTGELRQLFRYFQFIQADRLVPEVQYEHASTPDFEAQWLGCRGEYSVDFLARHSEEKISPRRSFPLDAIGVPPSLYRRVAPTDGLLDQVAGWLQQLSPGVCPRTVEMDIADKVSLRFEYTGERLESGGRSRRPSNVGFGLTYSLPIVVACLAARPGALILLENPEAHLHPQGQAALGELMAKCASDGVQIIVETHSDHVLNGVRLAVKNKVLRPEDVSLQYFVRDVESGESSVVSPQILPDGQLMDWPKGFFDQWDRSLDALLA